MMFNRGSSCYSTLLIIFCLTLTGCSSPSRESIAFGLNTAPVTLDPRYATDAVSYRITRLLYRSLIDFDANYEAVPDLASWQQLAPDHYRFQLGQDGRQFHDGTRLTAVDVKATYESILSSSLASPHRGSVDMIDSIEVIDQDTLDFILKINDPLFPGRLVIGILPSRLIQNQHAFNRKPVGSGPMRFDQWQDESRLILTRIRDGQPIELITVKDPTVRVLKLLRGEIDIIQGNLAPEMVSWLRKQNSVNVTQEQGNTFTYIGFNLEDSITSKAQLRQAIAHAIDRDAIIHYVMSDTARLAGAMLPAAHWAGHPELDGVHYNPDEARRLLQASGYSDAKPLKLVYKTSNNPFRLRLATVIQSQLQAVGIDVEIRSYDWGTFYADIKAGRFQMFSLSWVGLKMPDIFRYVFHSQSVPPQGANRGRLSDAQTDKLIEQAEAQPSMIEQAIYYRELQAHLLDILPYVPLWYEDNVLATSKSVQGYTLHIDGNIDALRHVTKTRQL